MQDSVLADWQEGMAVPEAVLAMDEFLSLSRQGRSPDVEEFLSRHPGCSEELRPVLEAAVMVRRAWEDSGGRP